MKKLTKLDRFYLKHLIREKLIVVDYDFNSDSFKEERKNLYNKYGREFIVILSKEIINNLIKGYEEVAT